MEFLHKVPTEIIYVSVAAVGGIARYLQLYLNEGKFAWRHLISHMVVSMFSGLMFYQFALNVIGFSEASMPIVAGMGGWMGVEALKLLESSVRERFQKTKK